MENIYLKLLKEFEPTGLSSRKSISPFMAKHFQKPKSTDRHEWEKETTNARLFLRDVKYTNHFDFDEEEDYHIMPDRWYDVVNINARITISGLEYLDRHQTNTIVTRNSTHQTTTLRTQTGILQGQRKFLYLTAFLSFCALGVSILTYISGKSTAQLQQELQQQSKQIHTLQIELSQAVNQHFQVLETKKILPKKN